ncbi:penicillin-binding protein 1C [Pseudooceanicola nitratireducens]|uniref:penicillin-binding protein 1C n=1 Tax=Pseudooceanicola nitratireducens TaxID=517719 RepID=UPI0023F0AED7|nr:penicillin-binding protein 1C [Pseudooceanicola nitratireducens]
MTRASGLLLALALTLWGGALARDGLDRWIDATVIPPLGVETAAEIRDRDGTLLRAYTVGDGLWRLRAGLDQIDPLYPALLMAYEDRRFLSHPGVDALAMLRAAWSSLKAGRVVSGGSTLTMQLARLLEHSGTGAWAGKLRQMRLALALERRLSKDQILTLYTQLVPMGGNLEGVRAASLSYFGKEPRRLTPAEAALLVALPQSPEARRPDRHPEVARAARDRVLDRSVQFGALTAGDALAARRDPAPRLRRDFPALAPHLTDRAHAAQPDAPVQQLTLSAPLQKQIEALSQAALRHRSDRLSIAILVADHRSGEILASVGSAGLTARGQGHVDMTQALRSPGSTLKPLVYGLAFDRGLAHPLTLIEDRPMRFDGYAPQNFDGLFRGDVTVAEALRLSLNLPAVQLTQAMGPQNLMAALRRAGTAPELPGGRPGLAVSLGGVGLRLTDLVQLYAGLANGGMTRPLHWQAAENTGASARILSRASAWQVAHILSDLAPPPGAPASRLAFKTGTSYGHRDAWAIGFDGAHVIGVWMGRPDGTAVPGAFGGDLAAPVLFDAFTRLKPTLDPLPPPPPETLLTSAANLPAPLRRFTGGTAQQEADHPRLTFPPDGAVLGQTQALPAKVRDGVPPFTWLVDGAPRVIATRRRETLLEGLGQGFADVTVIDASGRSSSSRIRLD